MVNRIDLRVNGVDPNEVHKLCSIVKELAKAGLQKDLVNGAQGNDFVLTMQPASLSDIKKILHDMLSIVPSERIVIET